MRLFFAFVLILLSYGSAQWNDWDDAESVKNLLRKAMTESKTYYSQFDWFSPRKNDDLKSIYSEISGVQPLIYGVDFYYASGSFFPKSYINDNKGNLISIVKKAWQKYRAIPLFSWHLENPYVPSNFEQKMGCRYRYSKSFPDYPEKHRYVIREILSGEGDLCGMGNKDKEGRGLSYPNPRAWFEARVEEIANIINEMIDDEGKPIPIIFRLWHECEDNWMWWGRGSVSPSDYKDFFVMTEKLIKQFSPKSEILWAYGPDRFWKNDEFLNRYPGDDYVDIIGYDDYSIGKENVDISENIERARYVSDLAKKKGKVAALFETANKHEMTSEKFFMDYLMTIVRAEGVSLGVVQTWSIGKFSTINHRKDRTSFLKDTKIIVWN